METTKYNLLTFYYFLLSSFLEYSKTGQNLPLGYLCCCYQKFLNLSFNRTQVFKIFCKNKTVVFTDVTSEDLADLVILCFVTCFFMKIFRVLGDFFGGFSEIKVNLISERVET